MDAQEITFTLSTVISIVFGLGGALGVWFTLKGKVNIITVKMRSVEADNQVLHSRLNGMKDEVKENRERTDTAVEGIKEGMREMELRIIKEIHNIKS